MGKRKDMTTTPLEELRHLDHAVFGQVVIARQSTSEIKEASMFIEKPTPECRKLEKAKSDNTMKLRRQTSCQRSGALMSELQAYKSRTTSDVKYTNGIKLKGDHNVKNASKRLWRSAESPTVAEQRKMTVDHFEDKPISSTLSPSTNERRNFYRSVSQYSSCNSSLSTEDLSNGNRHLPLSSRKPPFYGSSSLSRGSSIEEETETDDNVTNEGKEPKSASETNSRRRVSQLVDELLLDIYGKWYGNGTGLSLNRRRHSANSSAQESDCCSTSGTLTSWRTQTHHPVQRTNDSLQWSRMRNKSIPELEALAATLRYDIQYAGSLLVRQLKRRDALISRRDKQNDVITAFLQALSEKRSQDTRIRFSVMPYPGDSGFTQWHDAMKMVARLPGGIPAEFRRRLWLTVAEKHLQSRGVDWAHAERFCFNEWSNPDDEELGVQIVKDLHRTGCSLFCGAAAEENQALLKRVLLAYARWNKAVGYCQGFNMLAALILQVMDRSETDSVKVMIYLIEGVLPESYFANNLRGLSVDMAVFRDLLRLRLPTLSRHLEQLQHDARDSATGTSYEPPLTNVFTMQWFLTLFSNCLPQPTVLRVWDLIFLEGNEVLLRTALAIWDGLADRIMAVDSADEFYSIMGVLTREMLEFGLMDTNNLIKTIVTIAPFPFPELPELRDKYLYNITPWTQTVSTAARRGLRLFYSDDDDDGTDDDDEKIAVAAAYGISAVFRSPRRRDSMNRAPSPSSSLSAINYSPAPPDRDRLALDISALKQQYAKLRERQRQAHIILTAACARQPLGPSSPTPVAMNHLLLGKNALLSVRGRRGGPPPGAVPPPANIALKSAPKPQRGCQQLHITPQGQLITASNVEVVSPQIQQQQAPKSSGETLHWKDTMQKKQRRGSQHNTIVQSVLSVDAEEIQGMRLETAGSRGIPVIREPGLEADQTGKEQDSESDESKSSTSTELCDEPDRLSDFDSEEPTSDTSSHVTSTGEPSITKLSFPSPADKSGLPTPESPLENDHSLLKPLKNAVVTSKSREVIASDIKPSISSPSEKLEGKLTELGDMEPSPLQQLVESEGPSSKKTEEILPPKEVVVVADTSPAAVSDNTESLSTLKENSDLTFQTEASTATVFDLKFSPLKEIFVCKTTPESSLDVTDNIVKVSISEDTSVAMSSKESNSVTEDDQSEQSSLEKAESPIKTDASDTLKQSSPVEKKTPVSSKLLSSFHISELKVTTSEEVNSDKIILKENKDSNYSSWTTKAVEDVSEVYGVLESDTHFTEQSVTHPTISEITQFDEKTEETERNFFTEFTSMKDTDPSIQKNKLILEITQTDHLDTVSESLQCLHDMQNTSPTFLQLGGFSLAASTWMLQDVSRNIDRDDTTKEGDVETKEEVKKEIRIERSVPERDKCYVTFSEAAVHNTTNAEEHRSGSADNNEVVSELLELNQRLQDREQVIKVGDQTYEVGNVTDRDISETDYAQMSDLLEMDQNVNLGRRNSERALRIIQENSEILQRILQCQARRPSKLSEEESNGGTTTIPSEDDSSLPSIPVSSSAENGDITSCQQLQPDSDKPETDSSESSILAVTSPKDGVSIKLPSEVSLSSQISNHSLLTSDKAIKVFPDHSQSEGLSIELQSPQLGKEEHGNLTSIECFDSHSYSIPKEFLKTQDFLEARQHVKQVSSLSSTEIFTLSPETPNKEDLRLPLASGILKLKTKTEDITQLLHHSDEEFLSQPEDGTTPELTGFSNKDPRFSLDSGYVKPMREAADVTQVLHPKEQYLSQSEDRTSSELIGFSNKDPRFCLDSGNVKPVREFADSSFSLGDNVHHEESRVHRPAELELSRECFSSTIQSDWKRFPAFDSSLTENLSSKSPKCFSPKATTQPSYGSYNSNGVKENLQFLNSPETDSLTSTKWTDIDDDDDKGEFRTDKHFIEDERTCDFQSHLDTNFSKFSSYSSPSSSLFLEKSKLKDDSSPIRPTSDGHDLMSHPSSSYSTQSSDFSTSKPYTSISRYEYSPTRTNSRNSEKESNTDYFQHESSKYRETLSSRYTKDSVTCSPDSFTLKSSSDTTEILPVDDYLQKSHYSSKKRLREDFQYSFHPDANSSFDLSSETQDVVHRTTTKDYSRPHSTIISDITCTEILNRSYSSSSIDDYLIRMKQDLPSPPALADHEQFTSSCKSIHDKSSSLDPGKTKSSMYCPTYEMDSSMKLSATVLNRHSPQLPRSNEFKSKLSTKDLSPPSYSSFPQSRWDKDDVSPSPIKSQNGKANSDSQTFSTESSLVNTSLSTTKLGKSYSPAVSPKKSIDIHVSLPPIKSSSLGSPTKSKSKFDPFPPRPTMRQPKELGIKLGLYSTDSANKNGKATSKKT